MTARISRASAGDFPKKFNAREKKLLEAAQESSRKDIYDEFDKPVLAWTAASHIGYGDPTGTGGDINNLISGNAQYEYHIKGTQTILAPVWSATTGLDIGMDQTNNDGVELTNGVGARCPQRFTVGTDPAFFFEAKLTIADVSGTDDCAIGFRKAEAYQANIDDYDEMACLNVISGNIKIETILNNAATTTSGTVATWADAATKTLRVEVSPSGLCKFFVDDVQVEARRFSFDAGEVVVPFLFFLHDSDVAGAVSLSKWRCGYL